jgi:hypothetical protein
MIVRDGEGEIGSPALATVERDLYRAVPQGPVKSAGIGGCACEHSGRDTKWQLCVLLTVRDGVIGPVALAEQLATSVRALNAATATIRVEVSLIGPSGPRCAADDPACGPMPYLGECAVTPEKVGHRRVVIEPGRSRGDCAYDGECTRAGCGNECATTREPHGPGTCELRSSLQSALCGCVEGQCRWFLRN